MCKKVLIWKSLKLSIKRGGRSKNLLQTGQERVRNCKDVITTQCSLLGLCMNVLEAWHGRGENAKDVAWT